MAAEINRNPRGVVELIDLNRQGIFPRVLGDEINPVVDTAPFYYEGRGLEFALATQTGIQLPGQVATIVVPLGQIWACRGLSMRITNVDAANIVITASILGFRVPGSFLTFHTSASSKQLFPTGFDQEGRSFEVPILMTGGSTFSFNVDNITPLLPTGCTAACSVAFYRLGL